MTNFHPENLIEGKRYRIRLKTGTVIVGTFKGFLVSSPVKKLLCKFEDGVGGIVTVRSELIEEAL